MADQQNAQSQEPSPELVKEVTDKVFALLLADLKRERERSHRKQKRRIKR